MPKALPQTPPELVLALESNTEAALQKAEATVSRLRVSLKNLKKLRKAMTPPPA